MAYGDLLVPYGLAQSVDGGLTERLPMPLAALWAIRNFGAANLGDKRRTDRAVEAAAEMMAHPDASLPKQMEGRNELMATYALLNNPKVSLEALLQPHRERTLTAAGEAKLVLMVEDSTELDFTAHAESTKGLGPIGDGRGKGLILHDTLAVVPEGRQLLGLAHAEVVLRQAAAEKHPHWQNSPEAKVWETSARSVGRPAEGSIWVHVSDRGSDIFEYMATCLDLGKHFLIRVSKNRNLYWEDGVPEAEKAECRHILDYARSLDPHPVGRYKVHVPKHGKQPARDAEVALRWAQVTMPPPVQGPRAAREHAALTVWLLRVWEPAVTAGVEPVEWILLSSLPITSLEDAYRAVNWYTCRWLCEDYHQCLKTGCNVERTQLDSADDIRRLLGFLLLVAVQILQLRQVARQAPDVPAVTVLDPLMVTVVGRKQKRDAETMTAHEFMMAIARLGGHQGRRRDGPPGWRTLWRGWQYASDLTEGARLVMRH